MLALLRVLGPPLGMWAFDRALRARGLSCAYDELDLSISRGQVELWHFALHPLDARGEPSPETLASLEHASIDVSMRDLLRGNFEVRRVGVEGFELELDLSNEGCKQLLSYLPPASAAPTPAPVSDANKQEPLELGLPFELSLLRLEHARIHLRDATATPPLDAQFDANLLLRDLGSARGPARMEFTLTAPRVLDVLRVNAQGKSAGRELDADMSIELQNLRAGVFQSQLQRLGLGVVAEQISFAARAEFKLRPHPSDPRALSAAIHLDQVRAVADGAEAFALDNFALAASKLSEHEAGIALLELDGLRGRALLNEREHLVAGGFEWIPREGAVKAQEPAGPPALNTAPPFAWRVGEMHLSNGAFHFSDRGVTPNLELELGPLRADFANLSSRAEDKAEFNLELQALPFAKHITLAGHATPFAELRSVSLAVAADGLAFAALDGRLGPLGLGADMNAGTARAQFDAELQLEASGAARGRASLTKLAFEEPDTQRNFFALDALQLEGFEFDPARALVRLGECSLDGLRFEAVRDAAGSVHALGLHSIDPTKAPVRQIAAAAVTRQRPTTAPRFELDRLLFENAAFVLRDEMTNPPTVFASTHARATVEELALGSASKTAKFTLGLGLESALESLDVTGTLATTFQPLGVDATATVAARGINFELFAPYLSAVGLTPTLAHGEFELRAQATAREDSGTWKASASVDGLHLRSEQLEIAAVERLALEGLEVGPGGVVLASLSFDKPQLRVKRDARGQFETLGLAWDPKAVTAKPAPESAVPAAESAPPAPKQLRLGSLAVRNAQLDWSDVALSPTLDATLSAGLELGPLSLAVGAAPVEFRATLASAENLERLECSGRFRLPPNDLALEAALTLDGLRAGPLARYLPQNVRMAPRSNHAQGSLSAALYPNAEGGLGVEVSLHDVAFGESGAATPDFQLGQLRLAASRLDTDAGVYLIDELALRGTRLGCARAADGTLELLGFEISPPATAPVANIAAPPTAAPSPAPAAKHGKAPRIEVAALDLDLQSLSFVDHQSNAAPTVASARLSAAKPLIISGEEIENLQPLELAFDGALTPFVSALHFDLRAQPLAREPRIDVDFKVGEIDARALAALVPSLVPLIGEGSMQHGVVSGQLGLALRLERRAPTEFDFTHGFGIDFDLEHLALRAQPDAEPVAALEALRVDVQHISPASGDVHIKSIEIERPSGVIVKRADGVHAFGLVITLPPPTAQVAQAQTPAVVSDTPTAVPTAAPGRPEIKLDSLVLREIDLVLRDESVKPPLQLVIDDLYAEVLRFTSRAFEEPLPVRFQVSLGSSPRPMPARDDTVQAAFDEIALSGNLSLFPAPNGRIKIDMSALDLRNFAGPAAAAGVKLGDGHLDAGIRVRLTEDGSADVDSNFTFSELSLDEPPGGPSSSILRLPAPLDVVLFALKNANDEHAVPLSFHVDHGQLGSGQLIGAALSCVGIVVGTAIASAPLRVVGTFTDLFGITGGDDPLAARAVTLDYAPGAIDLDEAQKLQLTRVIDALDDDEVVLVAQHAFGSADLAFSARMANPGPIECAELVSRTRLRKSQLLRDRDALHADARALYAVGRNEDALSASERLRAVERELFSTESSLDGLLELLRPNAERRAPKRTRLFCLDLAQARLDALAAFISTAKYKHALERTELRKPTFVLPSAAVPLPGRGRILIVPRLRKAG